MSEYRIRVPESWVRFVMHVSTTSDSSPSCTIDKTEAKCNVPDSVENKDLALFIIDRKEYINDNDWPMLVFGNADDMAYFKLKYSL